MEEGRRGAASRQHLQSSVQCAAVCPPSDSSSTVVTPLSCRRRRSVVACSSGQVAGAYHQAVSNSCVLSFSFVPLTSLVWQRFPSSTQLCGLNQAQWWHWQVREAEWSLGRKLRVRDKRTLCRTVRHQRKHIHTPFFHHDIKRHIAGKLRVSATLLVWLSPYDCRVVPCLLHCLQLFIGAWVQWVMHRLSILFYFPRSCYLFWRRIHCVRETGLWKLKVFSTLILVWQMQDIQQI